MLNRYYRKKFDKEKMLQDASILTRTEEGAADSSITFYEVMPGIELTYNFFHGKSGAEAESCPETQEMIEINHCRQGRFGCKIGKNGYVYLGAGEIGASILGVEKTNPEFPLGFYEGVSILIHVPMAAKSLEQMFPDLVKQIYLLKMQIEENDGGMMIRNIPELRHIFDELYHINSQIEVTYMKLKVLEIILTMHLVPYDRNSCYPAYYKSGDIEKIKAIRNEAVAHLDKRIPLKELVDKYGISLTNAKMCFKEVYGDCDVRNEASWKLLERLGFERMQKLDNQSYKNDANGQPIIIQTYLYRCKNDTLQADSIWKYRVMDIACAHKVAWLFQKNESEK